LFILKFKDPLEGESFFLRIIHFRFFR